MLIFENLLLIVFLTYFSIVFVTHAFKPFLILLLHPSRKISKISEERFTSFSNGCFYAMKELINYVIFFQKINTKFSQDLASY